MRRKWSPAGLVMAVVLAFPFATPAGQAPAPQAPSLTFRVESNYVEVAAYVTDRSGAFVRDLAPHELEVLEDGRPQAVSAFSMVDVPVVRDAPGAATAGVVEAGYVSNARQADGRAFVLLFDALHVSAQRIPKAKAVLREFVNDHMAANDQVAIVHVGRPGLSQDFTSDKRRLLASIDGLMGERIQARTLVKWEQIERGNYPVDVLASQRASNARQSLESLRRLIEYMRGMRGRRTAVLLVSEGTDMDLNDRVGQRQDKTFQGFNTQVESTFDNTVFEAGYASMIADEIEITMQAATRANVAVYTIDPRANANPGEETIVIMGPLGEQFAPGSVGASALPTLSMRREFLSSQQYLRSIAEQTGGTAIVGTNSFGDGFAQIVRDSSAYYLLGYRAPGKADGQFHRITVRSTRPGVVVRARKGYYAARAGAAVETSTGVLEDLLSSPMPIPGLTMRAASTVLPIAETGGTVRFTVEIDGAGLQFVEHDGRFVSAVDLAYTVIDPDGKAAAHATKTLNLTLTPATRAALAEHGLRYTADVQVPAGRHQVRLAARESTGGTSGSVFWDVDVPDFNRAPFVMSPVVLASGGTNRAPTVSDAAAVPALLPGLMTAARTFDRADTLVVSAVMHDRARVAHEVRVSLRIQAEDGTEVYQTGGIQPGGAGPGGSTSLYIAQVPLAGLPPGRFVMTVDARSSARDAAATQQLVFTIR